MPLASALHQFQFSILDLILRNTETLSCRPFASLCSQAVVYWSHTAATFTLGFHHCFVFNSSVLHLRRFPVTAIDFSSPACCSVSPRRLHFLFSFFLPYNFGIMGFYLYNQTSIKIEGSEALARHGSPTGAGAKIVLDS